MRLQAGGWSDSHGEAAQSLLSRVSLPELLPEVVDRALEPFPVPVRTLDALHLASAHFLRGQGQSLTVATFDDRMADAARALGEQSLQLLDRRVGLSEQRVDVGEVLDAGRTSPMGSGPGGRRRGLWGGSAFIELSRGTAFACLLG